MDKLGIVRERNMAATTAFEGVIGESDDEEDEDYAEEGVDVEDAVDADVNMEEVGEGKEGFVKMEIQDMGEELPLIDQAPETPEEIIVDPIVQEEMDTKTKFKVKQSTSSSDESDLEVIAPPVKKIKTPKATKKQMFEKLKRLADEQADREREKREVIIRAKRAELAEREREKEEKEKLKAEREAAVEETRRVAREEKIREKLAVKAAKAALVAERFIHSRLIRIARQRVIISRQKCFSQSAVSEMNQSPLRPSSPIRCSSRPAVLGAHLYPPRHKCSS
jgi:hypothetical protein